MGKMFAKSPSEYYLGIDPSENYFCAAVDLACMTAYQEDYNYHMEESREKSGAEAVAIGQALEEERRRLQER